MGRFSKCAALVGIGILLGTAACGDTTAVHVHGRVLRTDGSPAAGMQVLVFGPALDQHQLLPQVTTGPDGSYDFTAHLAAEVDSSLAGELSADVLDEHFSVF